MNPNLASLHPYPFEKLAQLKQGCTPPAELDPIALSIGEPRHSAPDFVLQCLSDNLASLSQYPLTRGLDQLRETIAHWLVQRFAIPAQQIDPQQHILPVNGTREALFAIAQTVIDPQTHPLVFMPNPFYQIYEGAALLAGAEPCYLDASEKNGFLPDLDAITEEQWQRCQLFYLCSPGNPTGRVTPIETLQKLIQRADHYNFTLVSDECYSEIYFNEAEPPTGLLQAAQQMGNDTFDHCLVFHSLSKRSNLPGLRSGFVAGDARLIEGFHKYRTYHGCAMSVPVQHASIAAWSDEEHVRQNRALYTEKFSFMIDSLSEVMPVSWPDAGFYLWPQTPVDDEVFARALFEQQNITVLPGKYLSRDTQQGNPGASRIRMALVADIGQCREAVHRLLEFMQQYQP